MTLLGRFQDLGSRRLAASATAFGAIALATALTVTHASASVIVETAPLHNWNTNLCLDSNYAGNVYTYACNWNDYYQNWLW